MSHRLLRLHRDARSLFSAAVDAVEPRRIIQRAIQLRRDNNDYTLTVTAPLSPATVTQPNPLTFTLTTETAETSAHAGAFNKLIVFAVGKCAFPMAAAADDIFGALIADGICLTKHGHIPHNAPSLTRMRVFTGGHPIPDRDGAAAAERICDILDANRSPSTLILLLLSGGSSALLTYPQPHTGIALADIQSASKTLQSCGADISELNAIRKHLSGISGGRFAQRAQPATVLTLILSDVVGSPLSVIGSGPTVPDDSTFADCHRIIQRYKIADRLSHNVVAHITKGLAHSALETPKHLPSARVHNVIVGSNVVALEAARQRAQSLGYHTALLTDRMSGDVSVFSQTIAAIAVTARSTALYPIPLPAAIIIGGEPTVNVATDDKAALGGRSQHGALQTAQLIAGHNDIVVLAGGTDGGDGPTDAAGAVVDGQTIDVANKANLCADDFIERCDSYHFFQRLDNANRKQQIRYHLVSGPTGTNTMDVWIALIANSADETDTLTSAL